MKKNWKLATLALATTGMMLTTACTEDNIGDSGIDDFACNLLNADITEDVTLKAGETYTLDGGIHVKNGATLKIEPGVKIEAKHDNIHPHRTGSQNRCPGYSHPAHRHDFTEEGSRSMGRTPHLRIRTYKRGHRHIRNR